MVVAAEGSVGDLGSSGSRSRLVVARGRAVASGRGRCLEMSRSLIRLTFSNV